MSALTALFVHTASVETFLGSSATGDAYAAPVTVMGFLDDGIVRVQTSTSEELVQKAMFYAALSDAPTFTLQSRVTVNGRAAQVTAVRERSGATLLSAVEHIEVDLT